VDGHLRAETTPDADVPVLVLDITEREADFMLATLDPLAAMATAHNDQLQELLAQVDSDSVEVQTLLEQIGAGMSPGFEPWGAWNPDTTNVDNIIPNDDPIQTKITVTCDADDQAGIRQELEALVSQFPSMAVL
jgi:hypothetical protein